jgi:hypothetical protein
VAAILVNGGKKVYAYFPTFSNTENSTIADTHQCDLQVPFCRRCPKEGYTCEGYAKRIQFVRHEAPPPGASGRLLIIRNAPLHPYRKSVSHGENSESLTFPFNNQQTKLAQGAAESALFSSFWDLYTPAEQFQPYMYAPCQSHSTRHWAESVLTLSKDNRVLRNALRAISLSFLGIRDGSDVMSHEGAQAYGQALVQMNAMLRRQEVTAKSETVLSTSLLLALYEQFSCFSFSNPSSKAMGWIAHTEGITSLLQVCGPEAYTAVESLQLLRLFRPSQLQFSLAFHKASPLASDEWCSIPWRLSPKTEKDLLYDILLQIPGALEKLDLARSQHMERSIINVTAELLEIHSRLQIWFEHLTTSLRDKIGLMEIENDFSLLAADSFMIHGIDVVESVMMFWAGNIIVLSILHDFANRFGFEDEDAQHLSIFNMLSEPTLDPRLYTNAITSTIKPFLRSFGGISSIQSMLIPVSTAIHYLVIAQARKSAIEANIPAPTGNVFSEENARERQPRDRLIDSREAHELSIMVFESSETNPWGALLGCFLLGMGETSKSVPG